MESEIKIGNKSYKIEDFYKLSNQEFENIYHYVINLEKDFVNPEQSELNSKYVETLNVIQKARRKLYDVEVEKISNNLNETLNSKKVEPVNDVDEKYNQNLENISGLYSGIIKQSSEKVNDLQAEKDKLIEELIASTPRRELTEEDRALEDEILKEYESKSKKMNILDEYNSKLANEQGENLEVISKRYIENSISSQTVKSKGLFSRLRNLIDTKLMPKRMERRVYKEKQGKLRNIIDSVKKQIDNAKKKSSKNIKDLRNRIKVTMATALMAIGMTGITPNMLQEKYENNVEDKSISQEYEFNFATVEDISAFSALVAEGDVLEFDAELDEEKLETLYEKDKIIDEEVKKLVNEKSIDEHQIKSVIKKILDIDAMDIPNSEKEKLLKEYLETNEDNLSSEEKINIIKKYNREIGEVAKENQRVRQNSEKQVENKGNNGKEDFEKEVNTKDDKVEKVPKNKSNTKEEKVEEDKIVEKSDYDKVKEINSKINTILSNVPRSSLESTLKTNLKGIVSEKYIEQILKVEGISNEEISNLLKDKVLDKYLENEMLADDKVQDDKKEDYKKLESILSNSQIPASALKQTLKDNIKYIDESDLSDILSNENITKDELESLIKQEIDKNYQASQLTGDTKKAYDMVDSIMNTSMPEEVRYDTILQNLKKYMSEKEISEIYHECYFAKKTVEVEEENQFANIEFHTTPEGDKYFINDAGEKIFISDEMIEQLMSENNTNNYEYEENYTPREINKMFEEKLKERILKMQYREENSEIYDELSDVFNISAPDSEKNKIIAEKLKNMPEIKELVKAGILDFEDIKDIAENDSLTYEKIDEIAALINDGNKELNTDENTKEMYKFISEGIEKNDQKFMDKLEKFVALDAMKDVGIIKPGMIEDILNNPDLSNKEKENMIKDLIEDGNEKLEKLGYKGEKEKQQNQTRDREDDER